MIGDNWKIGTRLGAVFGVIISGIVVIMLVTMVSLARIETQCVSIKNESFPSALLADQLAFDVVQVQQFLTDVSATHDPGGYKDADDAAKDFLAGTAKFEAQFRKVNDAKSLQLIEGIKGDFLRYDEMGKQMANAYVTQGIEAGNKIMEEFDKSSKTLNDKVRSFRETEIKQASSLNGTIVTTMGKLRLILMITGLLILAFTLITTWYITRGITKPLKKTVEMVTSIASGDLTADIAVESGDETGQLQEAMRLMAQNLRDIISQTAQISSGIASASAQLYSTSEQIAGGADRVTGQTNTVATASEEMQATSADIARNCALAAEACRQTTESATDGARVADQNVRGMDAIVERVRRSSASITSLGARSEQIGEIIAVIEDIADQTNLLALNAAIEAARAGEQGRGFAVVADEVRALAERTTKATREIGEMIKGIQGETRTAVKEMEEGVHEVETGAELSQKSGRSLEEILERINDVTLQINQIATAAEEQTATTMEVASNIHDMTGIVNQSSQGAQETAAAAQQLATQAQQLHILVGQFRV
jgi:methyl-accepting chemotaxis protein